MSGILSALHENLWVFFRITSFDFNAKSCSVVGFGNLELLSPVLVFWHFFSGWQSSLSSKSVHSPIPSQKFSLIRFFVEGKGGNSNYVKQHSHYARSLAIATHKTARSTKYKNKVIGTIWRHNWQLACRCYPDKKIIVPWDLRACGIVPLMQLHVFPRWWGDP